MDMWRRPIGHTSPTCLKPIYPSGALGDRPDRSPEHPGLRGAPINRGSALLFRYGHFFLVKTLPLRLLISTVTDLSIGVPVTDTPPVSPSL
ncbi:hypothetical protein TIFTF001_025684 [Ficus carica]|uniref:Uncharacterized protein n=1 Tax=Ficus carica TaxID=3494 RepID=A0AA88AP57_FICCA|nr:hypothetical protein TIFTF001_025684 [Ficus carica]